MIISTKIKKQSAFTIVELLVVIVVIGILAGITIVSYTGISNRAVVVSLQSDLANSSTQLKIFNINNGYYPTSISTDCVAEPTNTTRLCLKASPGNSYATVAYRRPNAQSFILTGVNGNNTYHITNNSSPTDGVYVDPNFILIGTQTWARANMNVGTMVTGATTQTNNSILEKYCYSNLESNCTTYGGLYQWKEAMQYNLTAGTQGICLADSHIPTDAEWKTLEIYLGMTQGQADSTGWRGTDEGGKLRVGGISGLNVLLAGSRSTDGTFANQPSYSYLWSSNGSGGSAIPRGVTNVQSFMYRESVGDDYGFSVRCIAN